MTVSVNSAADRKKKGTEDEHFSIIEERKVVSGELENNCLDTTGVADLLVVNMEKLEGAVSNRPDVQIRCGEGQAEKIDLGLITLYLSLLKLNSDAAVRPSYEFIGLGRGCTIRNADGWVVAAFARALRYRVSAEVGEYLGLREGLGVAKQLGFFVALVEVDASTVVEGINLLKPSLSIAGFVINDIRALSSEVGIQKC
ncbi:hypothetical protein JRO89_XS03G0103300 [Xanthoceras sorbifolium]|uniref:RNase H type-1 domain-containing protein n=1 Tax=Xanthoceras sorbifolium TaxID=99658 RepID=A0ABQ8I9X2_9ROSI|nr:hypothetical protein JRO89_XS03G0103300 [Xanthoceras sorbifolium]